MTAFIEPCIAFTMDDPHPRQDVNVSRPVAIAFVCVLFAALMMVAYLLGRDHERRHQIQPQPVPAPTLNASPGVAPPAVAAQVAPAPSPALSPSPYPQMPTLPQPANPYAAEAPAPPPPAAPATMANSGDAAAVQSYFTQMDQLAGVNPFGDDAQGTAEKLLASAMGGDTSGFDAMIKIANDAVAKAQAITPPSACAHYHAEMIEMLQASATVMTSLKQMIARSDSGALGSIAASATGLQSRASALQREQTAIKQRYGIR